MAQARTFRGFIHGTGAGNMLLMLTIAVLIISFSASIMAATHWASGSVSSLEWMEAVWTSYTYFIDPVALRQPEPRHSTQTSHHAAAEEPA